MENKIKTGLPYDFSKMNDIRENGAIVDMNELHFPSIDDSKQMNVAIIFLRNTDYEVELDFSNCSYEMKEKYILSYLTDMVEYKIEKLVHTWLAILCSSLGIILEDTGILSKDELVKFTKNNLDIIGKLLQLLISLPVYAVKRFEYEDIKINVDDIEKNDLNLFNDNLNYLLYDSAMNIILETETVFKPMDYIHYFTNENDKLFTALQEYPYMAMLVGMVEKSPVEWRKFLDEYKDIFKE